MNSLEIAYSEIEKENNPLFISFQKILEILRLRFFYLFHFLKIHHSSLLALLGVVISTSLWIFHPIFQGKQNLTPIHAQLTQQELPTPLQVTLHLEKESGGEEPILGTPDVPILPRTTSKKAERHSQRPRRIHPWRDKAFPNLTQIPQIPQIHQQALEAFTSEKYGKAYKLWSRVTNSHPGHKEASLGLIQLEKTANRLYEQAVMLSLAHQAEARLLLKQILTFTHPSKSIHQNTKTLLRKWGDS